MPSYEKHTEFLIQRGNKASTPLGTTIFVGLRVLDGFVLQRALQVLNPWPRIASTFNFATPLGPPAGGAVLAMSDHALTPYQTVVWAMAVGASLKHAFWATYINGEPMYPAPATVIAAFNTVINSINTMLFLAAGSNPAWTPGLLEYVGPSLFATGLLTEAVSEVQRKWFKDDPRNKGKPYSGGLFGLSRNINYFGYMLWRGGLALATGGWVWGLLTMGFFTYDFCGRAIPEKEEYCAGRYGEQWRVVREKVPHKFCPGIY